MPTYIRVKDLPNSASSLNADDFIMLSGSIAGARKIQKSDFLSTVADEFNAAPSTYKLATLDASNKVDSSQWPASAFSYQGTWAASSNTPTLANGSGTAGYTYYASDSGSVNFGAGAISFTAGDAVVYDGSIWQKVPDVANILDGKGTVDEGKTTLQIPDVGTAANEVSLNGMLNSGAWLDFDAFYETGTWTPTVSFGGASVGLSTSSSYGHYLKVGSLCYAYGRMVLTSKGTSEGNAELSLPLTAASREDGYQGGMIVEAANLASLTSTPSLRINNNVATGTLKHWSSTGTANLTHANFTGTTIISYAATYQIA